MLGHLTEEKFREVVERYKVFKKPKMRAVLRVQDEALSALRDYLRSNGFVEILAPIIGPVTDPGIRGAKQAVIDYYGHRYKIMSSMILYKQMAILAHPKVFALSPNVRLEPVEALHTGRHLTEFRQVDVEMADVSYDDAMKVAEELLAYVCARVRESCSDELASLGRELRVPKTPFKRLTYDEVHDILTDMGYKFRYGEEIPWEAEEAISREFEEPFFVIDYPISARGFYDREDPARPGILRDFDMMYPEGYGEAVSGGEREYTYEKVLARMRMTGEDPSDYGWYLDMLKEGIPPSAGFGIGVERLTRFLCGLKYIWEAVPFPKLPNLLSP